MRARTLAATLAVALAPTLASAQANPVATAFRGVLARQSKNLVAASEEMPADKYGYKPTPAQMSFGDIVEHLAGGNDLLCAAIGGVSAPKRAKVAVADGKEKLVARLKESFQFCDQAIAKLDDTKLAEKGSVFGMSMTRAEMIIETAGDWADHYSQQANYLRLTGHLPPTAKKKAAAD